MDKKNRIKRTTKLAKKIIEEQKIADPYLNKEFVDLDNISTSSTPEQTGIDKQITDIKSEISELNEFDPEDIIDEQYIIKKQLNNIYDYLPENYIKLDINASENKFRQDIDLDQIEEYVQDQEQAEIQNIQNTINQPSILTEEDIQQKNEYNSGQYEDLFNDYTKESSQIDQVDKMINELESELQDIEQAEQENLTDDVDDQNIVLHQIKQTNLPLEEELNQNIEQEFNSDILIDHNELKNYKKLVTKNKKQQRKKGIFTALVSTFCIALIMFCTFVIGFNLTHEYHEVIGASMQPTLNMDVNSDRDNSHKNAGEVLNDSVFVSKVKKFNRGDIVVCKKPSELKYIIKRVIALGGDKITVEPYNGDYCIKIIYAGQTEPVILLEEYLPEHSNYYLYNDFVNGCLSIQNQNGYYVVPEDGIFVLGDNRGYKKSQDSADEGAYKIGLVVGKVDYIIHQSKNVYGQVLKTIFNI